MDGGEGDDLLIIDYSSRPNNALISSITSGISTNISGYYLSLDYYWYGNPFGDYVSFSNIERFQINASQVDDNIITGSGNDFINGAGGNDTINAGGGADKIVLADAIKQYYDDLNTTTDGRNDYANIIGFETHDIIQLAGSPTLYRLNVASGNTELYLDKLGSEPDELIGIILGVTNLSLTSDNFIYVQPVNLSVSTNAGTEAGTTVVTVTATASSPVLSNQSVNLTVTGTGITTGDYTLSNNVINIPNGGTTGTRTFTIVNDTQVEGTETATIAISSISSGLL